MPSFTLLLLFFTIAKSLEGTLSLYHFTIQDTNSDKKLTHSQFIDGLYLAFQSSVSYIQGICKERYRINNFGREFLGEQDVSGLVWLQRINYWIETEQLIEAYDMWVDTTDDRGDFMNDWPVIEQKKGRFRRIGE